MATSSPFSLLNSLFGDLASKLSGLQPPDWVVDEVQHRLVLLLNHVLMQEPEATARLARLRGRSVRVQWRALSMTVAATPAGLLELDAGHKAADLSLVVADDSPVSLAQTVLTGDKPPINIEGDVQLAAEVNWLVDHVRWDIEEDLSKLVGDAAANTLVSMGRQAFQAMQQFIRKPAPGNDFHRTAL